MSFQVRSQKDGNRSVTLNEESNNYDKFLINLN